MSANDNKEQLYVTSDSISILRRLFQRILTWYHFVHTKDIYMLVLYTDRGTTAHSGVRLVGCFKDLRRIAIFQPYRDLETEDNQSLIW